MKRLLYLALLSAGLAHADSHYNFTFAHDCSSTVLCDPGATFAGRVVVAQTPTVGTVTYSGADLLALDFFVHEGVASYDLSMAFRPASVTFQDGNLIHMDYTTQVYGEPGDPIRALYFVANGLRMSYGGMNDYVVTSVTAMAGDAVQAVPEPETYALMLFGLTGVLGYRRYAQRRTGSSQ